MALTAAQLLRFELNYGRIKVVGGSKRLAIVANGREKARIDAEVEENYIEKCKKVPSPLFHHGNGVGAALALQRHIWHAFWKVAKSGSDARKHVGRAGGQWRAINYEISIGI